MEYRGNESWNDYISRENREWNDKVASEFGTHLWDEDDD